MELYNCFFYNGNASTYMPHICNSNKLLNLMADSIKQPTNHVVIFLTWDTIEVKMSRGCSCYRVLKGEFFYFDCYWVCVLCLLQRLPLPHWLTQPHQKVLYLNSLVQSSSCETEGGRLLLKLSSKSFQSSPELLSLLSSHKYCVDF